MSTKQFETTSSPILVALDFEDATRALEVAKSLSPSDCRLKVGKELFTRAGPALVEHLQSQGFDIFLDLKFHDIPNTVGKALKAAADLGVWMVNVHASGGVRMLEAAREAIPAERENSPILIAVTVLTSMDQRDLLSIGCDRTAEQQALLLASLAKDCGLDGVVCSAREAVKMKAELGDDFKLVTPGIRPVGSDQGDQRRIMTPSEAVAAGADYLVIGRPITGSDNPAEAVQSILQSLS